MKFVHIETVEFALAVYMTTGHIAMNTALQLTYNGTLGNQKWLSLVDSTLERRVGINDVDAPSNPLTGMQRSCPGCRFAMGLARPAPACQVRHTVLPLIISHPRVTAFAYTRIQYGSDLNFFE